MATLPGTDFRRKSVHWSLSKYLPQLRNPRIRDPIFSDGRYSELTSPYGECSFVAGGATSPATLLLGEKNARDSFRQPPSSPFKRVSRRRGPRRSERRRRARARPPWGQWSPVARRRCRRGERRGRTRR